MDVRRVLATIVVAVGIACDGGGDGFGDGGSEVEMESSYTCCLNGAFYECDDSDAVFDCGEGDTSGCSRDGGRDDECGF